MSRSTSDVTDDERQELKDRLMQADLDLRRKQIGWETPRNIAAVIAALAVTVGAVGGFVGYQIGRSPPTPIAQQFVLPPGTTITTPAPK
jgi:hypothetical protein